MTETLSSTVKDMIHTVATLTAEQVRTLDAAWRATDGNWAALEAAESIEVASPTPYRPRMIACDEADYASINWPAEVRYSYGQALYAIHAALIAEIASELISEADHATLTAAWRQAVKEA